MKLHRSALVAGLLALGVAACGDEVTVVEPTPPPPPPLAATMAPGAAVVAVGNSSVFAVNTTGGAAGSAASWTCASSNTGIASVATTAVGCQATGVAIGGATITATVTKGTETTNVGSQITVTDDASAVVTVNSINQAGSPAMSPFGGQLDVIINVERGDQILEGLTLMVDGEAVAFQMFAATAPPPDDDAAEQAVQTITLSFMTDLYDADTGEVAHLNGDHLISANLTVAGGTTSIASNSIPAEFENANGIHVSAVTLPTNSAMDGDGLIWYGGPGSGTTDYTALVIMYDGGDVDSVTSVFCGATTTDVEAPFAFEVDCEDEAYASVVAGDTPTFTSVTEGNAGPTSLLNEDHGFPIREDYVGPAVPEFAANPDGRMNGWINSDVELLVENDETDADPEHPDGWVIEGAEDTGVGGYTMWLRLDTTDPTDVDGALAATASVTPVLPDATTNNNDFCAVISATDDLGNESALPAEGAACTAPPSAAFSGTGTGATSLRGGVDIVAPEIQLEDSPELEDEERVAVSPLGNEFQVSVQDVGAVGNSGFTGAPVLARMLIRDVDGLECSTDADDLPGEEDDDDICINNRDGLTAALPFVTTSDVNAETAAAYYQFHALAQDAAGNQSAEVSRTVVRDSDVATITAPAVPGAITGSFLASAFVNDDLSIRDYYWQVAFREGNAADIFPLGDPLTVRLDATATDVDEFDAATFTNTNYVVNTTIDTFLGLQSSGVGSAGEPDAYTAGDNPLATTTLFARDQSQAPYSTSGAAVLRTTHPAAGIALTSADPAWTFTAYAIATSTTPLCLGIADGSSTCTDSDDVSTTFTVTATGTTATFPNPFSRVDFYAADAGQDDLVLLGTASAPADLVDDGASRVWSWELDISSAAIYAAVFGPIAVPADYTGNIYAFGVNDDGDVAIVSEVVEQVVETEDL